MATQQLNDFSGLTATTTLTTGNSGGASGDALDLVTGAPVIGSGGPHHPVSLTIDNGNAAAIVAVEWNNSGAFGTHGTVYFRMYVKISANPGHPSLKIFAIATGTSSASPILALLLNQSGKLQMNYGGSGTTFVITTATVPIGSWFRVEGFVVVSPTVGQVSLSLFSAGTGDGSSADETHTSAASLNTGPSSFSGTTIHRFGCTSSIALSTSFQIADIGVSSTGALGPTKNVGNGSTTLPKMVLSGSSTEKAVGTGATTLPKMVLSGSSSEKAVGTNGPTLPKMVLSGSSSEKAVVTNGPTLPKMVLSGSSSEKTSGTGVASLRKMGLIGFSDAVSFFSGATALPKMVLSGSSSEKSSGSNGPKLPKMVLSGSGIGRSAGSVGLTLPKMVLSGSSTEIADISGSIGLKKMILSGSASGTSADTSGNITLQKMSLSGTGSKRTSGSGGVTLPKMVVTASGISSIIGTGRVRMHKMIIHTGVPDTIPSDLFIFSPL